jgi:Ca2+-binding RTX toxin-like protein
VTLVDSGVTETTGLSTDGVHMDKTGYEMMAKAWLDSLTAKGQVEGLSSSTSSSPTKPTNEINGDGGANTLTGTNGDDIINGYGGNDILRGEFGADMLNGGTGKDTMYGGASDGASDVFIFTSSADSVVGTKRDTIYDFEAKTDDLDLRGITAQVAEAGQVFKLGAGPQKYSVWYTEGRSETFVRADVNGDTKADFEIRLAGLKGMTADDFILV